MLKRTVNCQSRFRSACGGIHRGRLPTANFILFSVIALALTSGLCAGRIDKPIEKSDASGHKQSIQYTRHNDPDSVVPFLFGTVMGSVVDYPTYGPIEGAWIYTTPGNYIATSDIQGLFMMDSIPIGKYDFFASSSNYENSYQISPKYCLQIFENDTLIINFILYPVGGCMPIPFFEPWDVGFYPYWSSDPIDGNWHLNNLSGNPAPCAEFYWSPTLENYSQSLVLCLGNGWDFSYDTLSISFDLYLSDYSSTGKEKLTVEFLTKYGCDTIWTPLAEFYNNGDINWKRCHVIVPGHDPPWENISFRLVASGEDSYDINNWNIDNVFIIWIARLKGIVTDSLTGLPIENAKITVETYDPVCSGSDGSYMVVVGQDGYHVTCEAEGYYASEEYLSIDDITTWDVSLVPQMPEMNVTPQTVTKYLDPGDSCSEPLVIRNDGYGWLTWHAAIEADQALTGAEDSWIKLSDTTGSIDSYSFQEISLFLDAQNTGSGSHHADIIFTSEPDVGNDTVHVDLNVGYVSVQEKESGNLVSIYPNPTHDRINIELNGNFISLTIFSKNGEQVYYMSNLSNSQRLTVDVSSYNPGIYVIQLMNDIDVICRRVIIY